MNDLSTISQQTKDETDTEEVAQYLTFLSREELFAIGILDVKEIIEIGHITAIPMMPDFIRGIINLRGSVVPVIDLSSRLGQEGAQLTKKSCIVLVEMTNEACHTIGMMVDELKEILEIDRSCIQPPPNFGSEIKTDFIRGMGKVAEEFIILLDMERVLSVEDMSALNRVQQMDPSVFMDNKLNSANMPAT